MNGLFGQQQMPPQGQMSYMPPVPQVGMVPPAEPPQTNSWRPPLPSYVGDPDVDKYIHVFLGAAA